MYLKLIRKIILFGFFIITVNVHSAALEDYKVVLFTENFPPFNMAVDGKNFAHNDSIDGISADIVREMFRRAGVDYSLTLRFPWDRIYRLTLDKPNYGLFSTTLTEERKPLFKWVGPLASTGWVLMSAPGSQVKVKSLNEAKNYRVGAYKNDSVSQHLESIGMMPINALRDQENIAKLLRGNIDLWATTDPVGRYLARQEGVDGLQTVLRFKERELYLALNKEMPDEIVIRLQKALEEMRKEGFIEEVTNNYL